MNQIDFTKTEFLDGWYDQLDKSKTKYVLNDPLKLASGHMFYKDMTIDNNKILYKTQPIKYISPDIKTYSTVIIGLDQQQQSCNQLNNLLIMAQLHFDSIGLAPKIFGDYMKYFKCIPLIEQCDINGNILSYCSVEQNKKTIITLDDELMNITDLSPFTNYEMVFTIKFDKLCLVPWYFDHRNEHHGYRINLVMEKIEIRSKPDNSDNSNDSTDGEDYQIEICL